MPNWQPKRGYCDGKNKVEYQMCTDWNSGNPEDCKNNAPIGVIGWQSCGIGSSPGGKESGHIATVCTPSTNDFSCVWGQNCFAITKNGYSPECDSTKYQDKRSYCDGKNRIEYKMCVDWANNDPNSCNRQGIKPPGVIGWQKCGIGSSPGGKEPGHLATICSPATDNFDCVWGQNCFAITKKQEDVSCDSTTFTGPFSNCDGNDKIAYYVCDNWLNNDPNSCKVSSNSPEGIIDWKKCALGSSPGGIVPNRGATSCPLPASDGCALGQECYAVVKRIKDDEKCVAQNPLNILGGVQGLWNKIWKGLILTVGGIFIFILVIGLIMYFT